MKDLGKTTAITTNKSESNNTIISGSCSYKNSVIGSSVSSFKSTLITLNQLRSEALQSHLKSTSSSSSPQQSPDQDIEIIEIFPELPDSNTDSYKNGRKPSLSEQSNTCVMDKHLSDLEHDNLNAKIQYDIVKYMKNLREKTLEAKEAEKQVALAAAAAAAAAATAATEQKTDSKNDEEEQPQADSPEPPTVVENTLPQTQSTEQEHENNNNTKPTKSEDESEGSQKLSSSYSPPTPVKIDKKVDKVFRSKSLDKIKRSSLKSTGTKLPRHNIYIATDRSKSQGSSPVRIVKVKSSSKSSRENSEDRLEPRRCSEGGILKRPPSPSNCIHSILKSRSPDRSCLKKSPECSLDSNSPRLSPRVSPRSSFRQPVCLHSIMKSPKQSSFENRSPERNGRKRSVSAHSSLDVPKGSSCYQYFPINDYQPQAQSQRISASASTSRRQSKSLERSSSRDSSPYYYSVSPERIYRINTDMSSGPMRSVSAENALMNQTSHQIMNNRSYDCELNYRYNSEAVNRALENMTCVECLYSRKPS